MQQYYIPQKYFTLHFELKFLELPELLLKWKYLSHHVLMSRMMKQGGTIKAESDSVCKIYRINFKIFRSFAAKCVDFLKLLI